MNFSSQRVAEKWVYIIGGIIGAFNIRLRSGMCFIHPIELIYRFFTMVWYRCKLVITNLRRIEFRIDTESWSSVAPSPYRYMPKVLIINYIGGNIFLCCRQTAMLIFHYFKTGNRECSSTLPYRKSPFYKEITEIVVVLNDRFGNLFMIRFKTTILPAIKPIGNSRAINPFFLQFAIDNRRLVHIKPMPIQHINLLGYQARK